MTYIDLMAYAAGASVAATYSMRTMIPLRVAGLVSNMLFIAYGGASGTYPVLVLHCLLLPMNGWRLHQMLQLVRRTRVAAGQAGMTFDWLKPFMHGRRFAAGDIVFRKGEPAQALFYVVSGEFRLVEIGATVSPGTVVGELGFVSPGEQRTLTMESVGVAEVLTITYDQLKLLYFQDPRFSFFLLKLITERLFHDVERLRAATSGAPAPHSVQDARERIS